jgi:hypothetical protein
MILDGHRGTFRCMLQAWNVDGPIEAAISEQQQV